MYQGVASGVGAARIRGKLRDLAVRIGEQRLTMSLIVLDVEQLLKSVIYLRQRSVYKCLRAKM